MFALSAAIRAKDNWRTKARDPDIRARWKQEATDALGPYGDTPLTEWDVEYVLENLAWYASRKDEATGIEVLSTS